MSELKVADGELFARLAEQARTLPRKRAHHNFHATLEDPIHRLFVAAEPGSYIRPHRHPVKWEMFLVLRGSAAMLLFDETGTVVERAKIDAGTLDRAVEVGENRWHSLCILAAETLLVEIKPGPYVPPPEHDFASWSPKEGDTLAVEFEKWMRSAQPGDYPPQA